MTEFDIMKSMDAVRKRAPESMDPVEKGARLDDVMEKISANIERAKTPGAQVPPWEYDPETPRDSFGWKMGYGDEYLQAFHRWYKGLAQNEQAEFTWKYPEPKEWSGFYDSLTDAD